MYHRANITSDFNREIELTSQDLLFVKKQKLAL